MRKRIIKLAQQTIALALLGSSLFGIGADANMQTHKLRIKSTKKSTKKRRTKFQQTRRANALNHIHNVKSLIRDVNLSNEELFDAITKRRSIVIHQINFNIKNTRDVVPAICDAANSKLVIINNIISV